jgi:glycerol-3-phosphate dehydrogenase
LIGWNKLNRQDTLATLKSRSPSVLIVGGGINGVGTFRDLTLQGVDTLLIDRADFCSGASAASSRMAHGGIRYLENGEFRLVRESVQERNLLIRNAPSLVRPLPTTIPIFKTFSGLFNAPLKFFGWLDKPSERGGLIIKIGLILYDTFTGKDRTVPRHIFDNRTTSLRKYPRINPAVRYTATYYDGIILSPERLTLELLLDAEKEGGHARSLNYVSLVEGDEGKVTLMDKLTGQNFEITPRLIINASGPWIDGTNRDLGLMTKYIGPTKGSHLVLDNPELRAAIGDHEFFFENKDGRIVLIFPLFDKVMVGTTDIPIEDPDSVRCTDREVDYFIDMVGRVFPEIQVSRAQIVFRFSGVRPLAYTKARNAGQITRDHYIQEDKRGGIPVYSLVGGKWTSFRAFSAKVTDRVLAFLGLPRKFDTQALPIGAGNTALVLKVDPHISHSEIASMAEREKIIHLDDLVLRRTLLACLGQLNRPLLVELANSLGESLGWDDVEKKAEVTRTIQILADRHGVRL